MYLAGKMDTPGMGFMWVTPLVKAATFVPQEIIDRIHGKKRKTHEAIQIDQHNERK